jgi:hypothetical protein
VRPPIPWPSGFQTRLLACGYCLQLPLGSRLQPFSNGAGAVPQRPSGSTLQPFGAASISAGAGADPQCPLGSTLQPFSAQREEMTPRSQPPKSHRKGRAPTGAAARARASRAAGRTNREERIVTIENLPFRGAARTVRYGRRLRPRGEYGATNRGNLPSKRLVFMHFAVRWGVDGAV